MICLVKYLYREAWQKSKKEKLLSCENCPFENKCKGAAKSTRGKEKNKKYD